MHGYSPNKKYYEYICQTIQFQESFKNDEAYNVVESMVKAKKLYKELIKQTHPDKHPNKKDIAEELTAMINNNKFNYRELLKIKDIVHDKLA